MEKMNKKRLIITVIVCLLPMLVGAMVYSKIPDQMPIHYNINNQPDQYADKEYALFGIPLFMAGLQIMCACIVGITTKKREKRPKIMNIFEWMVPAMTVGIYLVMIEAQLGSTVYVGQSIGILLGVLFILLGNYLPKMSYLDSYKMIHPIPKDEKTFRRYTRIMGYGFVIFGIIAIIISIVTFIMAIS